MSEVHRFRVGWQGAAWYFHVILSTTDILVVDVSKARVSEEEDRAALQQVFSVLSSQ